MTKPRFLRSSIYRPCLALGAFPLAVGGCLASTPASDEDPGRTDSAIVAGATYELVSVNSGLALDVTGKSTANGAKLQQWAYGGGANQKWQLKTAAGGAYEIVSVNSGKCADVTSASTANGAVVQQWDCSGGANQAWKLQTGAGGAYEIVSVKSGKCMDVTGVSKADGAGVQQWTCSGSANQLWKLVAIGSSSSSPDAGSGSGGLFANCSKAGGCIADCSPPANDPIATGNSKYDLYDGCILAAMEVAGLSDPWMGQLLKAQALNESGITPSINPGTSGPCGGQNCGPWAISAGTVSGDDPPGPCGSSAKDPATGSVDYSHSYGLFQSTPACEGTFLTAELPAGVQCTATTEANDIAFNVGTDRFYCESATSRGVTDLEGKSVKGYINAWQTKTSPLYATSIFNPAYQIYVYISYTWKYNLADANASAKGCSTYQQWYLGLAYWLTGNATSTCSLSGDGLQYVKDAFSNYQMLYNKAWPYPGP